MLLELLLLLVVSLPKKMLGRGTLFLVFFPPPPPPPPPPPRSGPPLLSPKEFDIARMDANKLCGKRLMWKGRRPPFSSDPELWVLAALRRLLVLLPAPVEPVERMLDRRLIPSGGSTELCRSSSKLLSCQNSNVPANCSMQLSPDRVVAVSSSNRSPPSSLLLSLLLLLLLLRLFFGNGASRSSTIVTLGSRYCCSGCCGSGDRRLAALCICDSSNSDSSLNGSSLSSKPEWTDDRFSMEMQ